MKILVISIVDFPGSHIVKKLLKCKDEVIGVDNISYQCKYNIIENSFFGQLELWFRRNVHKIIIAIKQWCNNTPMDISDIFLRTWICL